MGYTITLPPSMRERKGSKRTHNRQSVFDNLANRRVALIRCPQHPAHHLRIPLKFKQRDPQFNNKFTALLPAKAFNISTDLG